jgi:luciferase family oxidoreductase group 1
MFPLSVLDLSPVTEGSDAAQSFRNTLDLAQNAERLGYSRYWLAEHHGMPGIASAATSILISHVAAGTHSIRVGAGGIMLPNHSPLVIAEQFGTLQALYPGRIDLGLGRAPGSDQATAHALRRNLSSDADEFPRDVVELMDYMSDEPRQRVRAVPGQGAKVPVWILGSSLFGAQLAAMLGLPFAFASHFAPAQMMQAIDIYRSTFKASAQLASPYVMLGYGVFAAPTDAEAQDLATSMQQAFVNLRTGRPGKLPPPRPGYYGNRPSCRGATCSAGAQTGSGKTAAFVLPLLQQVLGARRSPRRTARWCWCPRASWPRRSVTTVRASWPTAWGTRCRQAGGASAASRSTRR